MGLSCFQQGRGNHPKSSEAAEYAPPLCPTFSSIFKFFPPPVFHDPSLFYRKDQLLAENFQTINWGVRLASHLFSDVKVGCSYPGWQTLLWCICSCVCCESTWGKGLVVKEVLWGGRGGADSALGLSEVAGKLVTQNKKYISSPPPCTMCFLALHPN